MGNPQWFKTIDGVNYTSTYNIVINSGIALTGGGSINVGANTFTNSGTYDGIIITNTNRIVHVKTVGTTTGSQVFLKKVSDNSQVVNVAATGDTDSLYTYTADTAVTGQVRKAGLVEVPIAGTITNQGLSLSVSQSTDPNY